MKAPRTYSLGLLSLAVALCVLATAPSVPAAVLYDENFAGPAATVLNGQIPDVDQNGGFNQYFFNTDAYFRFVDDARRAGITAQIVPGVMPISNFSQLKRFSDSCGAEIPRWIEKRMLAFGDDAESVRALGADVVAELCRRLRDGGAPSFHIYTLNRAKATTAVIERL